MSKKIKWEFYAESELFQSPDPRELPMPIFDNDGRLAPGRWPVTHEIVQISGTPVRISETPLKSQPEIV